MLWAVAVWPLRGILRSSLKLSNHLMEWVLQLLVMSQITKVIATLRTGEMVVEMSDSRGYTLLTLAT